MVDWIGGEICSAYWCLVAILSNPRMLKLMQLQGVNYKGAFALEAADEDPHRFSKASKLAAYGGFSPIVDSSGDEEENAKRRGGLHKLLDGEGRQDVKFFFTEAGQSVLTSCANSDLMGTDPTRFTTDHAETRFAGRGRQFEEIPFGSGTGNPPAGHGLGAKGRWMCEA